MFDAVEYARRFVNFRIDSPISGPFNDARYPFIRDPLLALSDIEMRTLVLYGPVQSMKSVFLEIAIAYFVDILRSSVLFVAQTDSDAKEFAEIKLNPFLTNISAIYDTLKNQKYNQTLMKWLWATHSLLITGPSESAQQSKSARFVVTDESHLWCRDNSGAMDAFDDRHSSYWNGLSLHGTTAADTGSDVDKRYYSGKQNEWNLRCVFCNGMVLPLWEEASQKEYNGHRVFQWTEDQSETAMLDSIRMVCPHCDKPITDTPHNRADMDNGAKYIAKNPGADAVTNSFRFNGFAPRWKSWRESFKIYLSALHSAKLGIFEPFWNWRKKQLVESNDYQIPLIGVSERGRDYMLADVTEDPKKYRVASFDAQQGEKGAARHYWALCVECDEDGSVRVIAFERCATKGDCLAFAQKHKARDVAVDFGDDQDRTIRAFCGELKWYALKSGDEDEFSHTQFPADRRQKPFTIQLPYSEPYLESAIAGKQDGKLKIRRGAGVPEGFCIARQWSKPAIYPLVYALVNNTVQGREFKVAKDITPDFIAGIHSYRPGIVTDKTTRTTRKEVWIKTHTFDHPFVVLGQCLLLLIIAGKYRLGESQKIAA